MTTTDYPYTTTSVVPVSCSRCGEDMAFTIEHIDNDHRNWILSCEPCGTVDDSQNQKAHYLFATVGGIPNVYIGSYWGPDDGA